MADGSCNNLDNPLWGGETCVILIILILIVIVSLQHRLPADPAPRVHWRSVEGQGQVSHGIQAALRKIGLSSKQFLHQMTFNFPAI